ncbi:hypothetical protein NGM37_32540, partial [Streptomyces sp. TRM76130]|nr:hypothetical protein [Streptomyces sp. TRM76130]
MLSVTEADLRYRYEATVTSRMLDEAWLPGTAWRLTASLGRLTGLTGLAASAYGRLIGPLENLTGPLPRPFQQVSDGIDAHVVLRFNGSETPAAATAPAGRTVPAGQAAEQARITPSLYTDDPARPLVARPG